MIMTDWRSLWYENRAQCKLNGHSAIMQYTMYTVRVCAGYFMHNVRVRTTASYIETTSKLYVSQIRELNILHRTVVHTLLMSSAIS